MTEFAGREDRLTRRASDASDAEFIAHRPQFDAWSGSEPAPRRQAAMKRPSRDAIRKGMVRQGQAVAFSAGFGQIDDDAFAEALERLPQADQAVLDNGFFMKRQMHALKSIQSRDSRSLEPSTTLDFGDSSKLSRDDMKALRAVARMNEQPIAEDAHGEGAEAREFEQNVAAYRKQAYERRFGEWKTESRAQREEQASKFRWMSPSTWGMFKNFGWAKKANARRQISALEQSMGGRAPKVAPGRQRKAAHVANDPQLFGNSASSLTEPEYRAWGRALPAAGRLYNPRSAKDMQEGRQGIGAAAEAEGVDATALGQLAIGATVKTPEEKAADAARLQRAIDRDPRGNFSYQAGDVVDGHALLGDPTKTEDIPDIVKDVFGMGGASASEERDAARDVGSSDDDASDDAAPVDMAPNAFQLRRGGRIAQ